MDEARKKRERLYQAALLKIAIKMRKGEMKGFEEIFNDILKEMEIDPEEFRTYLNTHMDSLVATVKKKGY